MDSQFIVGIDLGTTNSALAYCESAAASERARIEVVTIPQVVNPNEIADRTLLPSFLYIPGDLDFPCACLRLPWGRGTEVRDWRVCPQTRAESPGRLVAFQPSPSFPTLAATARRRFSPGRLRKRSASSLRWRFLRSICNTSARYGTHTMWRAGRATPWPNKRYTTVPACLTRKGENQPGVRQSSGAGQLQRHAARRTTGRILCVAREPRGFVAQARQGRRLGSGLRCGRRNNRL